MKKYFLAISLLCLALCAGSVNAATKYWDINGATPGAGGATPAGTWNTATTFNWTTDLLGSSAATTWTAGDDAVFSAGTDASGSFTVTIPSATTNVANSVKVEEGTILLGPGTVDFGTANGIFDVASGATLNISGAGSGFVVGTGGVTKSSPGVLFLGGSEGYTNSTAISPILAINGGIVDFSGETALGLLPQAARSNAVTIDNGATLRFSGTAAVGLNTNRGVTIGANGGTIEVTSAASTGLSLPGASTFTLNGGGLLTKTGVGRFTLNTTSPSFTGKYKITAGSISSPGDGRFGATPASPVADYFVLDGATATLRNSLTATITIDSKRGITLGAGGGTLAQPTTGPLVYNGIIAGTSGGPLRIANNDGNGTFTGGIVTLGGANTYDGATTIAASTTLKLGASGVIPDTSVVTLLGSAASLDLGGFDETVKSISGTAGTFALGGNTLTIANPAGESFSSSISGATGGRLIKNGSGVLTLAPSAATYSGGLVLNAGTLGVGGSLAFGTGGPLEYNGGKLSNTGSAGRTVASGVAFNLNVDVVVDDSLFTPSPGQILFNGVATLKNGNRTITVSGAANLGLGGAVGQDVAGRSLIKAGSGILALTAVNTYSGDTTINAGQININGTSTLGDATGTLHLSGGTLNSTATRTASSAPVANPIDVTADSYITTSSTAATIDFNLSTSTIGGSGGSLVFSNSAASGTGVFQPRFSGSGFNFPRPIVIGNGGLAGTTAVNSYNTTGTDQTFSGIISGNGSYVRNASTAPTGGRTIFTAANTYSGGTTVSRGTLVVNNTTGSGTGSGSVTVSADGTLGGNGTVGGPTTVSGTLAPGTSIGTLTFNSSLALSGTTSMEINKTAGTADKVVMSSGTATLGGNLTVVNLAGSLALNDTFDLFDGTLAGSFGSFTLPALPVGLAWNTSQLSVGGTGIISVVCDGTLVANAGTSKTYCSPGSAVIGGSPTASGGTFTGYTYLWSPSTGLDSATIANPTASPSSTTSYTVTVTDTNGCTATSAAITVNVNSTPAVSSGPPASVPACNGGAVNISVSATGGSLGYAWRKRGTGWGGSGAWALNTSSGSGAFYVGSSTDNDNFETPSNGGNDINTSGKAWGIFNSGGVSDAIRNFANLAVGQSLSVDMDNGNINGTVGLGLQNSSGENRVEFYFQGGDANYTVKDGTPHDSGIAFTREGVNVKFTLTGTDTYSITIKRYIDNATATLTGTLEGTAGTLVSRIRLFNADGGGGTDHNLYFNNIAAGVDDDNASNYTAWNTGDNFGNSPLSNGGNISGADTSSLTINPVGAGDVGSYDVVIFNTCGQITSSAASLSLNQRPTAVASGDATICNGDSTTVQAVLTGTGPWNVTWSDGFIQTAPTSPAIRVVSPSSTFTYTVATLTDLNCVAQAGDLTGSALVTVNPRPTSVVTGDTTICNGQSTLIQAALTGTGPWTITWSDGFSHTTGVNPDVRTVSPVSGVTYTVTALSDTLCTAQAGDLTGSAAILVNPRPTSVVSGSTTICPGASTTIQAALTGNGPWTVTWSDGFSHSVPTSPDSRLVSPASTTTYTVTALSDANCTALLGDRTGSATVTVEDALPPVINCPANITVSTAAGLCTSNVTFSVTANDNCGSVSVVSVPPSGSTFALGTTTVTNTANDGNGNISGCSFTVTVVDNEPPAITCPANITVSAAAGLCTSNVTFTVTATDNCGTPNLVTEPASGFAFPKGTNTVTSTADDGHGNTNQCSFTVTVVDDQPPFINCGQHETVSCMQGWGFTVPIVTDNCDNGLLPVIVSTTTNLSCGYTFEATRVWQVTDSSLNVTYCTQVVTTVDFIPPTITFCPPNMTVQCVSDIPAPNPGSVLADNQFDPCETAAPVVTFFSDVTNSLSPLTITRTYHASDACGNFVSCSHSITVHDSMPPLVTAGTIATCYTNLASAEAAALAATSVSDNCDTNPAVTVGTVGTCNATITVTATDASSNSASVQYTTHIAAPPAIGTITATESSVDVKDCAHVVVQGTVLISVQASAACGLTGGHPSVTLTNGAVNETATFDNESPAGTFNYHWDATVGTSNGTWTVTVAAADLCQTTTSQFTLCMNNSQITGQVQLEGFVGTGTLPAHTRTVVFLATDGPGAGANVLKTWTLALSNVSGDTFNFTLTDVPVGTVAISARTDWTLRSKVAVTLALNGAFNPVNFTGLKRLRGGDFDGNNMVTFNDYSILGINFFTIDPTADITGDGDVDFDDYSALADNWQTSGDPQ